MGNNVLIVVITTLCNVTTNWVATWQKSATIVFLMLESEFIFSRILNTL